MSEKEKKKEMQKPRESQGVRAAKLAMMLGICLRELHDADEPSGYHLGEALIESLAAIFNMEVVDK